VIVKSLSVGIIQTNCYIVGCEETGAGAIIDPGGEAERIFDEVEELSLVIKYILNTHAHFDHVGGNADLVIATGASLAIHPLELPLLRTRGGAAFFGLFDVRQSPDPDVELQEGDILEVGKLRLEVLFTPGHTPGHVSFYERQAGVVFDGDVLFASGIGRTDLPGGDYDTLMRSIHEKLLTLPDETRIYSGHGPATTVGAERRGNPWL
jgi:hydroxyacylglutathione hydrolase